MSSKLRRIVPVLIIVIGLAILAYPAISNYLNEQNASRAVSDYTAQTESLDDLKKQHMLDDAHAYNAQLLERNGYAAPSDMAPTAEASTYESQLSIGRSGMMAYLLIPKLDQTLPVYHGVEEAVLQVGIGHLQATSLPVGGESTHAVLSGHRGLPTFRLFTDLDQLTTGDVFFIKVLNETLAYQVDKISVVEPKQIEDLAIVKGEDYVTLVTCTPYGVNSHRLLVRGTRIPYVPEDEVAAASAHMGSFYDYLVWSVLVIAVAAILLVLLSVLRRRKRNAQTSGKHTAKH